MDMTQLNLIRNLHLGTHASERLRAKLIDLERAEVGARDGALVREHMIQSILYDIMAPLVGVNSSLPGTESGFAEIKDAYAGPANALFTKTGGMEDGPVSIGAHYRGDIAIAGRRSMFATDLSRLTYRLEKQALSVGPNFENAEFVIEWNELLLQTYFVLFGKENTVNEWVIEKLGKIGAAQQSVPYAVSFEIVEVEQDSVEVCSFGDHSFPNRWISVCIPRWLADILLPETSLNEILTLVTNTLTAAWDQGLFDRPSAVLDKPEAEVRAILSYLKKVRELREKVSATDVFRTQKDLLRHRRRAAVGVLLNQCKRLPYISEIVGDESLCATEKLWNSYAQNPQALDRTTNVLQAVLLYIRLTDGAFVTAPVYSRSNPGCCVSLLGVPNIDDNRIKLRELFNFLTDVMGKVATEANLVTQAGSSSDTPNDKLSEIALYVSNSCKTKGGNPTPPQRLIEQFLGVLEELCAVRHEGHAVSLTFVLGRTINLMQGTEVTHEFLESRTRMRFHAPKKARNKENRSGDQRQQEDYGEDYSLSDAGYSEVTEDKEEQRKEALALVRGNFAFFQESDSALFFSHPTDVIEVTHMVRLRERGMGSSHSNRRRLVQQWTKESLHSGAIAGICYGNGLAEVISDGRIIASHRRGQSWVRSTGFKSFWDDVKTHGITKVATPSSTGEVGQRRRWELLGDVVERVSGEVGHGTLLVIGNTQQIGRIESHATHLTEVFDIAEGRIVEELDEDVIFQAAIQDGAVLIDAVTGRLSARWQVRSLDPTAGRVLFDKTAESITLRRAWKRQTQIGHDNRRWRETPFAWCERNAWLKTLEWGTRHMAAISVTLEPYIDRAGEGSTLEASSGGQSLMRGANVVAIVVSADGPVWAFCEGRAIAMFQ